MGKKIGQLDLRRTASPVTPDGNFDGIFSNASGQICAIDPAGTAVEIMGDVRGPPGGTDNTRVALWDGTTGKSLLNSDTEYIALPRAQNSGTSVANELALWANTNGRDLTRSTGTGYARLTSGVLSLPTTIPAQDIAANVTGSPAAAGRIGETVTVSISGSVQTSTANTFADSATTITLSPGIWTLVFSGSVGVTSRASYTSGQNVSGISLTDSSNGVFNRTYFSHYFTGPNQSAAFPVHLQASFALSSSTTFKVRLVSTDTDSSTGTVTSFEANGTGISGSIVAATSFQAVRIG